MSMEFNWKERGNEEDKYTARRLFHEANTSIEYGEKTWTTVQTVRDLMQNHLDAESERVFKGITSCVFDEAELDSFLESASDSQKKQLYDFQYALYMLRKHGNDQSHTSRLSTEQYIVELSASLPIEQKMLQEGIFNLHAFLEATSFIQEETPHVSCEFVDTETGANLGYIPYETLRDESMYAERYRFRINGFKIVDRGSGYDHQLSSLFITSKSGKRHLRGKFGEGAKMSELHILRNNAQMKMGSRYIVKGGNGKGDVTRSWQIKPKVEESHLVGSGIEIEKVGESATGSSATVSFKNAKADFKSDMVQQIDPRINGLGNNIVSFSKERFTYPLPVNGGLQMGASTTGDPKVQYVQGIRVELAGKSHGYTTPWFSYDVLDSSVIGGRDRNEITQQLSDKIQEFWKKNDNPELIQEFVRMIVRGDSPGGRDMDRSPELNSVYYMLSEAGEPKRIFCEAVAGELGLEKADQYLFVNNEEERTNKKVLRYAEKLGYKVIMFNSGVSVHHIIDAMKSEYDIKSVYAIKNVMDNDKAALQYNQEFIEGDKEKEMRALFDSATSSVNALLYFAKMPYLEAVALSFKVPEDETEDEDDFYSQGRRYGNANETPEVYSTRDGVTINPNRIQYSDTEEGRVRFEKLMQVHILAHRFGESALEKRSLKQTQGFLDDLIRSLLQEDSDLLKSIPESFEYHKDPEVMLRLINTVFGHQAIETDSKKREFLDIRRAKSLSLTFAEAKKLEEELSSGNDNSTLTALHSRVFIEGEDLAYYNNATNSWELLALGHENQYASWKGHLIYKLPNGRYFLSMPFDTGAVLSSGEGKKREYIVNEGNDFLSIGERKVAFASNIGGSITLHKAGCVLESSSRFPLTHSQVVSRFDEHLGWQTYSPTGKKENKSTPTIEGTVTTAIPIEYGKDEWDNPVRVFQDIIQNHLDASKSYDQVVLTYKVRKGNSSSWVDEASLQNDDEIVGVRVSDNGDGYVPNEIATMGASSKKSPLFAGKYGEGQKMVAAAALRGGFKLTYGSTVLDGDVAQSWVAEAVREPRKIIIDGKEVEKNLVAFDVKKAKEHSISGAQTELVLLDDALPTEELQWSTWVTMIDPRIKDEKGNGGMSRYVRQLRKQGRKNEYSVGGIAILFDEPGAVYENGLRINQGVEASRGLSFGYDVPEVVTTRERNSYNPERLAEYAYHFFSQVSDVSCIEKVLRGVGYGIIKSNISDILFGVTRAGSSAPIWKDVAQQIWPGFLVHSSEGLMERLEEEYRMYGYEDPSEVESVNRRVDEAKSIKANMVHLDNGKILDVSKQAYQVLKIFLPTAEDVIDKMKTQTLPISPELKNSLARIVVESVRLLEDVRKGKGSGSAFDYGYLGFDEFKKRWGEIRGIADNEYGVAVAPIDSAFHGKAESRGVVFNEELLLPGKRRELAHVVIHEMVHVATGGAHDYDDEFLGALIEVAHYLCAKEAESYLS